MKVHHDVGHDYGQHSSCHLGDAVEVGDVLFDIETDKATMAVEATEDGFLAKILVRTS